MNLSSDSPQFVPPMPHRPPASFAATAEAGSQIPPDQWPQAIIDNANGIVWVKDLHGRFQAVNRYTENVLHLSADEIIGRTVFDLFPPDLAQEYTDNDQQVLATGQAIEFEETSRLEDGSHTFLSRKFPLYTADGQLYGLGAICTDITSYKLLESQLQQKSDALENSLTERQRAEQDLRESETRYRLLAENMSDTIWLMDMDLRLVYISPSVTLVRGYTLDELNAIPFAEQLTPESFQRAMILLATALSPENLHRPDPQVKFHIELEFYCRNKPPVWSDNTFTLLFNEQGLPMNILGSGRDITARKQTEMHLAASEARLSGIITSAMDAILSIDVQQRIVLFNPAAEKMFGCTAAAAIGQSLEMFIPPQFREAHDKYVTEFDRTGEIHRSRSGATAVLAQRTNGEEFYMEATISRHQTDEGPFYTVICRDITSRLQAEESLRRSQEHLQQAYEAADMGTWWHDLKTNTLHFDTRARAHYGVTLAEIPMKAVAASIHPDDLDKLNQNMHRSMTDPALDGRFHSEFRITHPNGDIHWISMQARLFFADEGKSEAIARQPVLATGITQDITHRQEAAAAQTRLEEQLRQAQKMESIGRLAGGVAHDFNNLLTIIQLYSDLMHDQLADDDPLLVSVEQIQQATQRATGLTRQLLAFSRKQILKPVILDLNTLITNLQRMLARLIGEDILLVPIMQPGLWPITADPGQLEQVIMNLAVNARDAMPTGGSLIIETANVTLDDSYLAAHLEITTPRCVLLSVTDTGFGMNAEIQAHIFEPFFTTKQSGQGTGLGLSTVHGIVRQSGGSINVYSEPGQGTTFKIYFPASEVVPPHVSDIHPAPIHWHGHETILLVEDENALRQPVQAMLQRLGYTVLAAENGRAALETAAAYPHAIDLLLTDVVMPYISGREVADTLCQIRQTTQSHPVKVLFMSGYTDDAVIRHGLLTDGVEFLSKPFSPGDLAAKIRQLLDQNK